MKKIMFSIFILLTGILLMGCENIDIESNKEYQGKNAVFSIGSRNIVAYNKYRISIFSAEVFEGCDGYLHF